MYYKGANLLHTIRQIVNDDEKWRQILRGLNKTFYHQTVTTQQIENYISQQAGRNLSQVFDQYLRDVRIPTLEYQQTGNKLKYRWTNTVAGFEMPLKVDFGTGNYEWIYPSNDWKTIKRKPEPKADVNFYVKTQKVE